MRRNKNRRLLVFVATVATLLGAASRQTIAQSTDSQEDLKAQIRELDQKLRVLQRKFELQDESQAEKAKNTPLVSAGASGFKIQSADSNFVMRVGGYIQADGRFFPDNPSPGTIMDTFLLRRVRPIVEGTVYGKYDYRVMLDFGQGTGSSSTANNNLLVQDAYVNARFWPEFQIQVGKFKEPVGLERLQSGRNLLFVERGLPTLLVPNRDVGIQVQGDLLDGKLSYAVGAFNGVVDGGSIDFDTDSEKDLAGRVFARPFRNSDTRALQGLGFGVSGTIGHREGSLRPISVFGSDRFSFFRTGAGTNDATANVVAGGQQWRISPQFYYYWGPLGLFGEYVFSDEKVRRDAGTTTYARLQNTAWQVAASYILTGEDNSFDVLTPRKPFSVFGGGWGAWELAARVGQLSIDDSAFPLYASPTTSAREITEWAVGINWHLNRNVKLSADYSQADFKGGESNPLLNKGLKAIFTRVQVAF